MIILLIVNLILLASGIVILLGKGDFLIAGYNTASEQERQRVNLKRLRLVVAVMLFVTAALISLPFLLGADHIAMHLGATFAIIAVAIVGVILANTWCMKK